jgi:hypothetical protein
VLDFLKEGMSIHTGISDVTGDYSEYTQEPADVEVKLGQVRSTFQMLRKRALKAVLVLIGVIFTALVYPMIMFVKQEPALAMMLSVYSTLGIFLLVAARNPAANRSLIAFTAWSSLIHAVFMSMQAMRNIVPRGELIGSAVLLVIGVALIALSPAKEPVSV